MQTKQLPYRHSSTNLTKVLRFNPSVSSFKLDFFAYRYVDHAKVGNTIFWAILL